MDKFISLNDFFLLRFVNRQSLTIYGVLDQNFVFLNDSWTN